MRIIFLSLLISSLTLANSFGPGQAGNGARSASGGTGITSLNSETASTQSFATGTSGTDFAISSSGGVHTFNVPTASGSNRGLLSTSDWTAFNAKLSASSPSWTGTMTTPLTASRALVTGASSELAVSSTTAAQIGYLSTLSSNAQTQLDAKAPIASPTFTGALSLEAGAGSDTYARIRGNNSTSGVNQYGLYVDSITSATATSTGYGVTSVPATVASAHTQAHQASFVAGGTKGSGSTITRHSDYFTTLSTVGTYSAVLADNATYTADHFINSTSSRPSLLTGTLTLSAAPVLSALTANMVPYADGSKVLTSSSVSATELGYLDGLQGTLTIEQIDGMIETPSNKTYILRLNAKYPGTISNISLKTASGTITAKLQKEGVDVTSCTAISVTSAESTTTCTGANTFVAGDTITLVTTSNSSAADLQFSVQLAR